MKTLRLIYKVTKSIRELYPSFYGIFPRKKTVFFARYVR